MKAETLKGHLDGLILATLAAGPAHGYAVIEQLKRRSGGVAVSFVVLQGVFGEGSLVEGLVRGAIEATGLIVAVLLLGRVLGLRR